MKLFKYLAATALILSFNLIGCGKNGEKSAQLDDPNNQDLAIVIFTANGSRIKRDGKSVPLKVGDIVRLKDIITTSNGSLDLQTKSGAVLRLRPYSQIELRSLMANNQGETQFELSNGGALVRVNRQSRNQKFSIKTPTSIASVRGTTFKVDVEDGVNPVVKVYEGKVAMRPRVRELEKYTPEQIENDPSLKKLDETIKSKEVILDEKEEGQLDPKLEQQVEAVNNQLKAAGHSGETQIETTAIHRLTSDIAQKPAVQVADKPVSTKESAELDTIVKVDQELIKNFAAAPTKSSTDRSSASETVTPDALQNIATIARQYGERLDQAMNAVEKKIESKKFKSNSEIIEYYKLLEIITFRDGHKSSGAIVAQAGNVLVLHSTSGVSRFKVSEIDYVDYVHKEDSR